MDKLDELLKIKELLDSGIISENEFQELKDKLSLNSDNINNSSGENNSNFNGGYNVINSNEKICCKCGANSLKEDKFCMECGNAEFKHNTNNEIIKKEIIISKDEKECPSCNRIIEKECQTCNFCDFDFTNNKINDKIDSQIENNNNLKKYIPVFFVIIIFIFLGTWFFSSNNSEKNEVEPPKVAAPVSEKSTSLIIKDSITLDSLSKMANAPAAESFQNSENIEANNNGEQIDNFIKYNVNCIKDLKTDYYWYIAPDKDFNFDEACLFSKNISEKNLNWRVPTYNEIKSLYNSEYSAGEGFFNDDKYYPAKIHNVFNSIGSGSWFWVSDVNANSLKAYCINLHEGVKVNFDKNPKSPVHLLLISK